MIFRPLIFFFARFPRDFYFLLQSSTRRPTNLARRNSFPALFRIYVTIYWRRSCLLSKCRFSFSRMIIRSRTAFAIHDDQNRHTILSQMYFRWVLRAAKSPVCLSGFTPCITRIDAPLAYRITSHRVSYDGKGWIVHEIIRTSNLNALPRNRESSDINCRDKKSRGRGPPLDKTNCSQRESRVTDIQRDELKQCQGRKGQE